MSIALTSYMFKTVIWPWNLEGSESTSKKFGFCKNQLMQQKKPVFVFFVFLEPKTDAVNLGHF
jgi:hypothetical protein